MACDRPSEGGTSAAAAFYPLGFVAGRVGGDRVAVHDLTPAGTEPHDLELDPDDTADLLDADLAVVMGGGFQPAVEDAVDQRDDGTVVVLDEVSDVDEHDPHVWLDPARMVEVVDAVERSLREVDPDGAAAYARNADALRADIAALDDEYRAGLRTCRSRRLVTSHDAFDYLAGRYDLEVDAVAGISPDAEPDPARLGDLADLAREEGVTTVFTEELVSPDIAETLAREAGGLETEVLSPIEGLTAEERATGDDYLSLMRENLGKLRAALGCS